MSDLNSPNKKESILLIAAESSSAQYAKEILQVWNNEFEVFGIGSREMEATGFECIGRSEEMSVVGFKEVLAHYWDIRKVFHRLIAECKTRKPKYALLLDYPDFNLRLVPYLHSQGIKVVYFISPQLWAWRKSRINIVKKYIYKMLVIFPFEQDFYKQHSVNVDFVGHPLLDHIKPEYLDANVQALKKSRMGVPKSHFVLALMPGSRRSELANNMNTLLETAEILSKKFGHIHFVLPVAPGLDVDLVRSHLPYKDLKISLVHDDVYEMLSWIDGALVASGTATVVLGLLQKPMVIMYKMSGFSAFLAKTLVKGIEFFGMINLIYKKELMPELFQEQASPQNLAKKVEEHLLNEAKFNEIKDELKKLDTMLGNKGACVRVANILANEVRASK